MASTCPYSQNSSSSQISFFLFDNQSYFNLEIFLNSFSKFNNRCRTLLLSRHLFLASNAEKFWAQNGTWENMSKSLQDASSPPPQIVCGECLESFESLSEAREHVELAHDLTSNSHCIYCHTFFSMRKAIKNICWRSTHYQFGMASRRALPLSQRKARSEGNCAKTISKFLKRFASIHDTKQGGNRCSHTGKCQRGSEQNAISCGSGDDQNSHRARRGH